MNINKIRDGISEVCNELKINEPKVYEPNTVTNPGPKPIESIQEKIMRKDAEGKPVKNLGELPDIFRCTTICENFAETIDKARKLDTVYPGYMGKVSEKIPGNGAKNGKSESEYSLYFGQHLHGYGSYLGARSEIQVATPELYAVKQIADYFYRSTREFDSMRRKYESGELSTSGARLFRELKEDYKKKTEYERRLFSLIRENTDLEKQIENIYAFYKDLVKRNADRKRELALTPLTSALEMKFMDETGDIIKKRVRTALAGAEPHMPATQKKLCQMVAGAGGSKIVKIDPLLAVTPKNGKSFV